MTIKLTFAVSLCSDYHVGAGQGAGPLVDSALLRDTDNTPILRGTILAGLLRDGLYDLLDLPPAALLRPWVEGDGAETRLFGSPQRRRHWAYSTAYPADPVEGKLAKWGGQYATRIRIDPRTRRAEPQKLFTQEEGDRRLVFHFTATCYSATSQDRADAALLVAAARMVRHLGSARRRGRGECRVELVNASGLSEPDEGGEWTSHALSLFRSNWLDAEDAPAPSTPAVGIQPAPSLGGERRRFRILARAIEPIIVARRSQTANAFETLTAIPGTTLLGALATRAAKSLGLGSTEVAPEEFVTLFLRGGVYTSGLTPAVKDDMDLFPAVAAPLSLLTCELYPHQGRVGHEEHGIFDAQAAGGLPLQCPHCGGKLKPIADYLSLSPQRPIVTPEKCEETHIRMNRQTGRVKSGDLFQYTALKAKQYFVGELDCANDACWQRLQELTGLQPNRTIALRLGKAAQRGYGLLNLVLEPLDADQPSPLVLQTIAERIQSVNDLRILFLTDTIVADPWERFYAGFETDWVAEFLGLAQKDILIESEFTKTRHIDSFNGHRRMPRWRDVAMVAGSTAQFRITTAGLQRIEDIWRQSGGVEESGIPVQLSALRWKLAQIEAKGIGLRRNEGFGCIAFNHPAFSKDEVEGIYLDDAPENFHPQPGTHRLESEEQFRVQWRQRMLQTRNGDKRWQDIDEFYEPLARYLYLNRHQTSEEITQWLRDLPSASYLWEKDVNAFNDEKSNRIGGRPIALLCSLVEELEMRTGDSAQNWATGLELLALHVVVAAGEAKKRKDASR